jgi:hypothetical protein
VGLCPGDSGIGLRQRRLTASQQAQHGGSLGGCALAAGLQCRGQIKDLFTDDGANKLLLVMEVGCEFHRFSFLKAWFCFCLLGSTGIQGVAIAA